MHKCISECVRMGAHRSPQSSPRPLSATPHSTHMSATSISKNTPNNLALHAKSPGTHDTQYRSRHKTCHSRSHGKPELYEAADTDHPAAARLRNAAIIGVKGNAAQHQVAWLQVPVDNNALAVRRPSTCHSLVASDMRSFSADRSMARQDVADIVLALPRKAINSGTSRKRTSAGGALARMQVQHAARTVKRHLHCAPQAWPYTAVAHVYTLEPAHRSKFFR